MNLESADDADETHGINAWPRAIDAPSARMSLKNPCKFVSICG